MTDTDTTDIEWEEPPPVERGRGQGALGAFVEKLKTNPGTWGVYKRDSKSQSSSGYAKAYPGTEWKTRRNAETGEDGKPTFTVYGRYVGEGGDGEGGDEAPRKPVKKAASKKAAARRG